MPRHERPSRVFISSASGEYLAQFRHAAVDVCHRLQFLPIHMEEFHPGSPPPLEVCHREVDGSDVFVLLIAHRYGSRPPHGALSFTELEYERALSRGLVIHIFLVDSAVPWPPGQIDHGDDAQALARFVDRVKKDHVVRQFTDLADFREDLLLTLHQNRASTAEAEPLPSRVTPSRPVPHAVPPYVSSQPFVGRTAMLSTLDEWAGSDDAVLVVEAIGGLGKSALCWRWFNDHAPGTMTDLTGRMWWSFYEGSASITRFLHEAAAYLTGRPVEECARLNRADLLGSVHCALRTSPYLLVLDGFERMLTAYHRFDPTRLRDDEVDAAATSLTDPYAYEVLRALVYCAPSKVLISSRLMPEALEGAAGWPIEGVRRLRLPGLTDDETVSLVRRLRVAGRGDRVSAFFDRLGNHPLLIGAVCGMVRDYRRAPGDFDAWAADPSAGAGIRLSNLRLSHRQTRVLAAVFAGLDDGHRRVLRAVSLLPGGSSYAALEAVDPYRPEREPPSRWAPFPSLYEWLDQQVSDGVITEEQRWAERDRVLSMIPAADSLERSADAERQAAVRLDQALGDLERRGLLLWDRATNTYDLHPVVRAFAHDEMEETERVRTHKRVRDHFNALPPEDLGLVTSVEDLHRTITVFRALAGAGSADAAAGVFRTRLSTPLYAQLGANETIIELLQPLTALDSMANDLAVALNGAYRFDEAHDLGVNLLRGRLSEGRVMTYLCLDLLIIVMLNRGDLAAAKRMIDLADRLFRDDPVPQPLLLLRTGQLAFCLGRNDEARGRYRRSRALGADMGAFFDVSLTIADAGLALQDTSMDEHVLRELDRLDPQGAGQFYAEAARLKTEYWLGRGRLGRAMTAADEYARRCGDKGLSPAFGRALRAKVFARVGNLPQARILVDEALACIDDVHANVRPYADLAEVLIHLDAPQAADLALAEYRRAWADGPPYCYVHALRRAQDLIRQAGATAPALAATDPQTVRVPLENQLRALITG